MKPRRFRSDALYEIKRAVNVLRSFVIGQTLVGTYLRRTSERKLKEEKTPSTRQGMATNEKK